jgi:hypothetical protein
LLEKRTRSVACGQVVRDPTAGNGIGLCASVRLVGKLGARVIRETAQPVLTHHFFLLSLSLFSLVVRVSLLPQQQASSLDVALFVHFVLPPLAAICLVFFYNTTANVSTKRFFFAAVVTARRRCVGRRGRAVRAMFRRQASTVEKFTTNSLSVVVY